MNPYWKKKWLAALRSGEYQQGQGTLKKHVRGVDKYCCLGVLCDLPVNAGWTEWDGSILQTSTIAKDYMYLGNSGRRFFDISLQNERDLVRMNDDGNKFKTIANWIEKNL